MRIDDILYVFSITKNQSPYIRKTNSIM